MDFFLNGTEGCGIYFAELAKNRPSSLILHPLNMFATKQNKDLIIQEGLLHAMNIEF